MSRRGSCLRGAVLGALVWTAGCGTRTVTPLTLADLKPGAAHLASLNPPAPDLELSETMVPVWARPAAQDGHALVGALGTPHPLRAIDMRTGKSTMKSDLNLEPFEGAPPDWFVVAGWVGVAPDAFWRVDPDTGDAKILARLTAPFEAFHEAGSAHVLVVDAVTTRAMRLRSVERSDGTVAFSASITLPLHVAVTERHAVAVSAEAISRWSLDAGEIRQLDGEFSDVVNVLAIDARRVLIVRRAAIEVLDLESMQVSAKRATGMIAFATSGSIPARAVSPKRNGLKRLAKADGPTVATVASTMPSRGIAVVTQEKRLLLVADDGAVRFETDVPLLGTPTFSGLGLVTSDGRTATLVDWEGARRWEKRLPAALRRGDIAPRLLARGDTLIFAGESAVLGLDAASGDTRYSFAVRGASPGVFEASQAVDFTGGIDPSAAAAREARMARLLGRAGTLRSATSSLGSSVAAFGLGASAASSQSLLQSQVNATLATDNKRQQYAASHRLSGYLADMGARERVQGDYFVRRLQWFWGEGVLVVRLRDGAWREVVTGPSSRLAEPWHCHTGLGVVAGDRLLTLGMKAGAAPYSTAAAREPSGVGLAACPISQVQIWDLSKDLRPADEYPRGSIVEEGRRGS